MSSVEFVLCIHVMGFLFNFDFYMVLDDCMYIVMLFEMCMFWLFHNNVLDVIHLSIVCVCLEFIAIDLSC